MKNRLVLLLTALLSAALFVFSVTAGGEPRGQPFKRLQHQIDDLQYQVEDIWGSMMYGHVDLICPCFTREELIAFKTGFALEGTLVNEEGRFLCTLVEKATPDREWVRFSAESPGVPPLFNEKFYPFVLAGLESYCDAEVKDPDILIEPYYPKPIGELTEVQANHCVMLLLQYCGEWILPSVD